MTLSPRLTQERLAELLREVDALHDGLAPLTPEQKAAWLLPHLGAQEAPHVCLCDHGEGDGDCHQAVGERCPTCRGCVAASAGSSAVPPSQNRDVIGWLVVAAEALVLVADDEVAGLPQRLRSHGHLDARDREALKRTKEMCDAVLRATAVVREQIGASSPPAVSGPPLCKNCRVEIRPGEPHISIDNQGDFCSGECLRSDDAKIRGGPR